MSRCASVVGLDFIGSYFDIDARELTSARGREVESAGRAPFGRARARARKAADDRDRMGSRGSGEISAEE